jgi:hypothetical protein
VQTFETYDPARSSDLTPLNRPTAVLTPRGHMAVTVLRLKGQLIALDAPDRAWIAGLLRQVADDVATA